MSSSKILLSVDDLSVFFDSTEKKGERIAALREVSFELMENEVLGIVGESGCGKSTLARTILQLQEASEGKIGFVGEDVEVVCKQRPKEFRRNIQLIFQDPLDALNPRMTVGQIISEPLRNLLANGKTKLTSDALYQKVVSILQQMGLQEEHYNRYPHEFSGGQCQRIGIARAMIVEPSLLICDEPVSALDVSIQAQIINLLIDLKAQTGMSMLFISHDLSVVRMLCERILVLYKGEIVEIAPTEDLFERPQHPYTQKLLDAIPLVDPKRERERIANRP